jgi:hypothetical protein
MRKGLSKKSGKTLILLLRTFYVEAARVILGLLAVEIAISDLVRRKKS